MARTRFWMLILPTCLALSSSLYSQVPDPVLATQAPVPGVGHHYIGIGAETVNPADGSLTFDLPLQPAPGRGLDFRFGIHFAGSYQYVLSNQYSGGYGGLGWSPISTGVPTQYFAWSYTLPALSAQSSALSVAYIPTDCGPQGCSNFQLNLCWANDNYVFQGLDGIQTSLGIGSYFPGATSPQPCSKTQKTPGNRHGILSSLLDQSYSPPVQVVDQSGTTYSFPGIAGYTPSAPYFYAINSGALASSITDRNGNQLTRSGNSYKDSTGRTAVSWTGIGTSGDQITVAGLGGPATLQWIPVTVTFPETGYNIDSGSDTCSISSSSPWPSAAVSEIDLPNGQKYKFAYETVYGKISKITFPDGGYVRYVWGLNTSAQLSHNNWAIPNGVTTDYYYCDFIFDIPAITDRYVSFDGTNEVLHQQFSYSTSWNGNSWASKQTKITSTDQVSGLVTKTTYNYSPVQGDVPAFLPPPPYLNLLPVETSVVYQDGTGSTTYLTVNKSWQSPHVMLGEQIIPDNNNNYGTATLRCYDSNEQVTNLYEYGFPTEGSYPGDPSCVSSSGLTAAARGPLRRQSATPNAQFWNWNNGSPTGTHIVNAPASSTTSDGSGTVLKQTLFGYDQNGLISSGAINLASPGSTRANITTLQRLISGGAYATTTYTYYDTGQVATMTDPCGNTACGDMTGANHTTSYSYADNYASGTGTAPGQTNAYLTQMTDPNTGVAHTESFTWGYSDGQIRSRTDQNGRVTSFVYNDPGLLGRLTEIDYPDTGKTTVTYNDSTFSATNFTPSYTVTQAINSSTNEVTTTAFDGMGHKVASLLTSDPQGTDYTATTYDGFARARLSYNPTRCNPPTANCGESTWGYSTTNYDALGRVSKVVKQDGSSTSMSYSGPCTTATDEAGKSREACVDGLGRLAFVWEDPAGVNYETDYTYNALGNLTYVNQKGDNASNARTRTFGYDLLSRLTSASNPESGAVTYSYDANSNLGTKTAPSPNQAGTATVTTTFTYDALNRLTGKSYNDSDATNPPTPPVHYGYDGVALSGCTQNATNTPTDSNPIGNRTQMCEGSSSIPGPEVTYYTHDTMGRVAVIRHLMAPSTTTSTAWGFSYAYNLDGSVYEEYYGLTGHTHTYNYNGAAQPTYLTDGAGHTNVNSATYTPFGALATRSRNAGGTLTETFSYNIRLQPAEIYAGYPTTTIFNLCYDFHSRVSVTSPNCSFSANPSGDNGNVYQVVNTRDTTRTANYLYDSLNRISQAYSSGASWGETYGPVATNAGTQPTAPGIDAWGNLTNRSGVSGKTKTEPLSCQANSQNQLVMCSYTYDAAGNMTYDGTTHYTYDAENRIIQDNTFYHFYDGDGNRVAKCTTLTSQNLCAVNDSSGGLFFRDASGESVLQTTVDSNPTWTAEFSFFGGQRIARLQASDNTVHYYFSDHLGSMRVAYSAGAYQEDLDYYPYGGLAPTSVQNSGEGGYMFTGKERDAESGLDNFGARYDSSSLGRFMTADPLGGKLVNPQTLNRYAYVANNPINFTDPTGLYMCADDAKDAKEHCTSDKDKAFEAQRKEALKSDNADTVRGASAYGDPGKDNGVSVAFGDPGAGNNGVTSHDIENDSSAANGMRAKETVTIRDTLTGTDLKDALSHEGSHVADAQSFVNALTPSTADYTKNLTKYQTELRAYMVTQSVLSSANEKHTYDCGLMGTCQLGAGVTDVTGNINRLLDHQYHVTPQNQGSRLYPAFVPPPPAATVPH